MSDIVTRLRDSVTQARALDRAALLNEAADEIARRTLTGAEREAVERAADLIDNKTCGDSSTLRGLLDRLKLPQNTQDQQPRTKEAAHMNDENERSVASDGYAMLPTGFKAWAKTLCDQINETGLAHAANYIGLAIVLIEKGIISKDELEAARAKASVMVNHHCVTLRDEQSKETLETLRKLFREQKA